ncbi:MAG: UvrD-helicase domain-containing protein [Candidatus Limnocylindria bacterium]
MIAIPADQAVRDELRHDLETTFFVEAGAGTGKTSEIVARITELAAAGRIDSPRKLVAITFTVAAAAELRARIREGLEMAARDESRSDAERINCAAVAHGIDEAAIDTIHAFAGSLLRTFPLEAGLPPNFETLDGIEQDIEFDDRFRDWFEQVSSDAVRGETVRRALVLGMTTDQIRAAAEGLHGHYDMLHGRPNWESKTVRLDPFEQARLAADDIRLSRDNLRDMRDTKIGKTVEALRFAEERLRAALTVDESLTALRTVERVSGPGSMDDFGPKGRDKFRLAKNLLGDVKKRSHAALHEQRRAVFVDLLEMLAAAVLQWSTDRKERGVATFHDLMTWSRDLLRDNAEVRRLAQDRWSQIFVDEFQDTDPLQAELAFYLAAEPDGRFDVHWSTLSLVPGKLFLVGDPKQSIYRFRRADITLYHLIQKQIRGTVLSQNFRSVPRIVQWVNLHYGDVMKEKDGVQPRYQPLAPEPEDTDEGVSFFGGPLEGAQAVVWEAEAKAVARCAHDVVAEAWQVSDGNGRQRTARAAEYRDICVLIPSRTNLKRLERAFEDEGVPYRLESGELIVATQEIRDLVSCLRSIDDPSDQVALVATLRSAIYGCSDEELLVWVEGGGQFRYEWIAPGAPGGRVREALEDLRRLHRDRHGRSVPALIEGILAERLLIPAAFAHTRPREAWRRYRYLVDRARAYGETGRTSLRSFVDWIEGLERDQHRGTSPAVAETDENAVRVMTVHGAKGLEFPVVILTGWGSKGPATPGHVIADRSTVKPGEPVGRAGALEVGLGTGDERDWATAGYQLAKDREKELIKAEGLRLSYVASTRARDHLVVSLFRKAKGDPQAEAFAGNLPRFELAQRLDLDAPRAPAAYVESADLSLTAEESLRSEQEWIAKRQNAIDTLGAMDLVTATSIAHDDESLEAKAVKRDDGARFRRGRGATALGRAVHAVLETIDLATLDGLDALANIEAGAEGIGHRSSEVIKLAHTVRASAPVRAALASGRYWREVPVGAMFGDTTIEGVIDLLYEVDGTIFVIDYKTDDVSRSAIDERMAAYRLQGGAYAYLAAEATKARVGAVEFIFARSGEVRRLDDVPALLDEVWGRLRDREGGALVVDAATGA